MSVIQHLVSPKLPTALPNDTHVDLAGQDLWLTWVTHVHVVPTKLDLSKFEEALSKVLQLYPHATGQLRCNDGRWSIELTNTAVPVDIEYKPDMSSDSFLDGNWTIQEDISPLLNEHPIGTNLINTSAPLLRLKLIFFDHETSIGVAWNHSLGDATMMARLLDMLSQFYQDLPARFSIPTFKKHHFPAPSPSMVADLSSRMSLDPIRHLDIDEVVETSKDQAHLRWRFNSDDLEVLRSAFCSDGKNKNSLSKNDCLIAYLVAVLNYNKRNALKWVRNVCSYRNISAPFVTESVAGSLLLVVPVLVPTDMSGIATAVRDALIQARDPQCAYAMEALKSENMTAAANAGKLLPVAFDDDQVFVNSNNVVDWHGAHFGYPDGTRFYVGGVMKNLLKCYRSNPTKRDDGVWQVPQSVDISMGVPGALKPRIMETLARGVQFMIDNHCV